MFDSKIIRTSPFSFRPALLGGALAIAASQALGGVVDVPYTFGDGYKLTTKVGGKTTKAGDLKVDIGDCEDVKIGTYSFEYQLYTGNHPGAAADTSGTAGLDGGFTKALPATVKVTAGFDFAMVQIVRAKENPGVNTWGAAKNEWFVDNSGSTTDPVYTDDEANFSDYPDRSLSVDEKWDAELALVLIDKANTKIQFLGHWDWGFEIKTGAINSNDATYGKVSGFNEGVAANFTDAFKKDWPGRTDFKDWMIVDNALTKVPAPGTLVLTGLGLLATARRRRSA